MTSAGKDPSDLDAISADIAALKRDIAALMAHVKADGRGRAAALGDEASEFYSRLAAEGASAAKTLGSKIDAQPLTALLVAFAVGFLGGRLFSR